MFEAKHNDVNNDEYVELESGTQIILNDEVYEIVQYVEDAENRYGIDLYELERYTSPTSSEVIFLTDYEIRQQGYPKL